ncbi:serine hydrolase domain-containing protein [Antrihabitans stalagmiti]|nr:serine hydrolase domain-containing protein [Antrihabitans stalagmiti]
MGKLSMAPKAPKHESGDLPGGVRGSADPRFATAVKAFGQLFARHRGGGALSVYVHGEPVVDVWAGTSDNAGTQPWGENTGAMPYSATKGIASTVIHRLADRSLIDYDAPVAEYWPEFGANGKSKITVRTVLTHRAGLYDMSRIAKNVDEVLDFRLMEERLAAAKPGRLLGTPTYHSLTYGWLLAGIARSVTGKGMAELYRTEIAEPLGVDGIYLGRPPAGSLTTAAGFSGRVDMLGHPIGRKLVPLTLGVPGPLGSFMRTVYVPGFESLLTGDRPRILDTEMPAANGTTTARGLAAMYGALASNGETANGRFLSAETVRKLSHVQTRQYDRTLYLPLNWRLGYHSFPVAGATRTFGHVGFAGSGGYADRDSGVSIGFVHNRLPHAVFLPFDQSIITWLAPLVLRGLRGTVDEPRKGLRTAS